MVEYMHDIMDRVTNISWRTTRGARIGGFEYEYDAAGRIVSRSHPIGVGDRLASYGRARSSSAPRSVVRAYTYDAWGNVVEEEIAASALDLAAIRYRFQGREWSAATGLTNFRMRWYDPETGRWLSKDPIRLMGGINLYAFCDDNILNNRDPFGLCPTEDEPRKGIVDRIKEAGRGTWNFIKALPAAIQEAVLPSTSGTALSALEGVPTGAALGNQIKALHDAMESLENGGVESGDEGNILKDSEDAVRRNSSAIDDAINH